MTMDSRQSETTSPAGNNDGSLGITLGIIATGAFYTAVYFFPHPFVQRYFLGHWVCIAATLMFCIAAGILGVKWLTIASESRLIASLRDADLSPALDKSRAGQADDWLLNHHAGRFAQAWLTSLQDLPSTARKSRLVQRLSELLDRQADRVSTRHLADDIRELSARDADAAHDSLSLIRIIVWAIPMLGFLGTVVGITRTLGDLDFTNGDAAIENLKTGLYVAFDTTAIGLVLSVVAIFLQFPVERAESRLLGEIDYRTTHLLNSKLPSDDAQDNPAGQIAALCDGIRVAVAESLASQTQLWRQTIDEAHLLWQKIAEDNGERIGHAIMQSLAPELRQHAQVLHEHTLTLVAQNELLAEQSETIKEQTDAHKNQATTQVAQVESLHHLSAQLITQYQTLLADQDTHWTKWHEAVAESTAVFSKQQEIWHSQLEQQAGIAQQLQEFNELQSNLDSSLLRLVDSNQAAQQSIEANLSGGMSHAMMTLASAVEVLAVRLSEPAASAEPAVGINDTRNRRAA